jgi:hypothetical protein
MTFKPSIWYPIAVGLSVINLVAVGFAARPAEPWHATIHAGLALAFGLWARHLRSGTGAGDAQARLEELDSEINRLREEVSEMQERLDFAERVLAKGPEPR